MCRAAPSCSELGKDPANWSRRAPLPPPDFFDVSLERFVKAFSLAESGDVQGSLQMLETTRSDELRSWFVEHGQMSGWHHRVKGLKLPQPKKYEGLIEQNKSFTAFELDIYMRDGYRCRYCMIRVIDARALLQFENWVGSENFKVKGKSNQIRHGVALSFRATADHVLPISHGGRTSLDNLVTACWNCNYGKYNALLEQMDVDDPRGRSPMPLSSWNGLM